MGDRQGLRAWAEGPLLWVSRRGEAGHRLLLVNFGPESIDMAEVLGVPATVRLSSVEEAAFMVLPGQAAAILHLPAMPQRLMGTEAERGAYGAHGTFFTASQ